MSSLQWDFPLAEMSGFLRENMAFIMPILVIILAILFAMIVIDRLTDSFIKIIGFVAGVPTSSINDSNSLTGRRRRQKHPMELELDDDDGEPD